MSDSRQEMFDFIRTFRAEIEASISDDEGCMIHPSGAAIIRERFREMFEAANRYDDAEVARLADTIRHKAAQEMVWAAGSRAWVKRVRADGRVERKEAAA